MYESQKAQIISHMEEGGWLTPILAIRLFGCTKLATRISELIREGYPIIKDWHHYGNARKVRKYCLNKG